MKIPCGWIREFVELDLDAGAAADRLVNAGIEVASVTPLRPEGLRGVVVGAIEAIEGELGESHGHRLVVCRVSTGRERFRVVCGAPNAAPGVRAAFAPPGASLPGGRAVGVARVRGVESQGMLCSERELGLGEEHEAGLLLVDGDAAPGADLAAHLGLDDSVLEVEVTPNRPDCLSVVGVARELSALTGRPLRVPAPKLDESDEPVEALARARIDAPDLCARFSARVISDVRVGPSPAWLAARLRAVGLRPISNVVDVTNYVLWERGQPLHAFDHAKVTQGTVVVRRAEAGERVTTLDGQARTLDATMLVIADPRRAMAVAGIMGGGETEVTAATRRVLLESAYFTPASIRRTSRALGLATDAAYRFERGADIEGLVEASARAAQLIAEVAGGRVARGLVDVYPAPRARPRVRLRMARVRRLLGVAPTQDEAAALLGRLGLDVTSPAAEDAGGGLEIEVPSFRRDLTMEDDLVEEVIRVWGYDRIPSAPPAGSVGLVRQPASLRQEAAVRRALAGAGLAEVIGYRFSDPALTALAATGEGEAMALLNPLSADAALMRRHPLEGVLSAVALNLRHQQPDVAVFEVGRTYARTGEGIREPRWLALGLAGMRHPPVWWEEAARADLYDVKGLAEHALEALGVRGTATVPCFLSGFEGDRAASLAAGGVVVATFGEVALDLRTAYGIEVPVFAAALPLDTIAALPAAVPRYEALPRFPSVARDMAFLIGAEQDVRAADIEAEAAVAAGPLLRELTLFDVFRFPDGRRSLAWRLVFQAADRTLTDDEVNAVHARVVQHVSDRFTITLRGQ